MSRPLRFAGSGVGSFEPPTVCIGRLVWMSEEIARRWHCSEVRKKLLKLEKALLNDRLMHCLQVLEKAHTPRLKRRVRGGWRSLRRSRA